MRNKIPKWGWYNGMFQFDFEDALHTNPKQTIEQFYNDFRTRCLNNIAFPLKNQGTAISLLYMLLVVPRELWERTPANNQIRFPFVTKKRFNFQSDENVSNDEFIKLMRNSIAHANFDMNENGEYTFWNERKNGERNFKVKISHRNLFLFISEVGKYFINEVEPRVDEAF
jgi:hypothetical protein